MSTFSLAEAVHVCRGNQEFDFAPGQVTAKDFHDEAALDHLVELEMATVVNRTPPPAPEPLPAPEEAAAETPPPPPSAPPEPVTDTAGITDHEET